MAAQQKSRRGRTRDSKLHCVLPQLSAKSGEDRRRPAYREPTYCQFLLYSIMAKRTDELFFPYDAKRRAVTYKGQFQRGGSVPHIIH